MVWMHRDRQLMCSPEGDEAARKEKKEETKEKISG